jgi:hypothetical protein
MARDGDLYAPHWQRWAAQEERHLAREATRDRADLVLDASRDGGRYTVLTDRTLPGGIGSSRPEGPR